MENQTNQNNPKCCSVLWVYPVAMLVSLVVIGVGAYQMQKHQDWAMLSVGALCFVATIVTWPIAMSLSKNGPIRGMITSSMEPVYDRLEQFSVMMNEISEQQLLSDRAKTVAYREKDRDALRRAIQEDIARKDWEGALVLVNEMDNIFGYKQEAERIREEITQKFSDHIRRQIHAGVSLIERHTSNQQWAAAMREADRLVQQFPTIDEVRALPNEIEQKRQAFKQKLLDEYRDKMAVNDTDGAINVVKRLDFYLTPEEAVTIQESVRGLFKDKINQLRDQIAEAVHQSRFADAVRTMEIVINDFPNTQLARECRDKVEALRKRTQDGKATVST